MSHEYRGRAPSSDVVAKRKITVYIHEEDEVWARLMREENRSVVVREALRQFYGLRGVNRHPMKDEEW